MRPRLHFRGRSPDRSQSAARRARTVMPGRLPPAIHQDAVYFGHARPELLALIPTTARTVLDIGCGAGRLGEAIKARQPAEVVGVELNETAAAAARAH